eukprot:CAMPEP_0119483444 /NCGR_PEP_ID=MMETSP1344-20130328/10853_1 /TAXON_ID=236787 /ORGANISM="Florenciella parvula, Strain CCMP2471" /LENGTH=42 /DNA_ID= /DNA_START= /DNA_END= /DNA_ORIENTATION=
MAENPLSDAAPTSQTMSRAGQPVRIASRQMVLYPDDGHGVVW